MVVIIIVTTEHFKGSLVFCTMGSMVRTSSVEKQIDELKRRCIEYSLEASKKEHTIFTLNTLINQLQLQLNHNESAGALARKLLNKADNKIMYHFNEHGKRRPPVWRAHPQIFLQGNESYQELINSAKKYDIKAFFVLKRKVNKSSLRLHYRIAAKLYRTLRGGLRYTSSGVYRKLKKGG